jgi:hypothetical protein
MKFRINGTVTISIHTEVEAESEEEAKEKAFEQPLQSFCAQCADADDSEEWVISGELDGEPVIQEVVKA